MRKTAPLFIVVALQICCTAAHAAHEMKFKWPVPSRVGVTETALKKGQTAKLRYDIVLEKQKTGDNLELKFENFQFLEVNGMDLSAPEAQTLLGPLIQKLSAMQGALPSLIIDPQGVAVDVAGMETLTDKALGLVPNADSKLRASIEAVMKSPEGVAQVKQKTKDFWRVWVQTWVGCSVAAGKEKTVDTEVPFMNGKMLTVPLVIRNEGKVAESPGDVQLTASTTLEGEEATKAFAEMMQKLTSQIPVNEGAKPFSADMVKALKRVTKFTVVTNPNTLQPKSAHSEIVTDVTVEDKSKSDTEKHDYTFDWPN